ncbi:MAG TPA: SDR family NAD(P)-dependent oxidoreductase, partial [Myxococcaceae bacterium]|nr:SDR family NAD(P)-dependent oxidoreductase [Myxococcaceae bacterium]
MTAFLERYGPWALVAGASAGLGEAFARALVARGLRVVLVARRSGPLEALASELRARPGAEVRTAALDLARPGVAEEADRIV